MGQAQLLVDQLQQARQFLEGTMDDVTEEQAQWLPPGVSNPLGATYGHIVTGEDTFVNMVLRGAQPLSMAEWADKQGMNPPPPPPFPPQSWDQWGRQVKVDLDALRKYAHAVFANTESYVGSLSDDQLAKPMDLSALGLGQPSMVWVVSNGILGHRLAHWGEISCLKGLQGAKGYPF
jgi:hypothetical protein